MLTMKRFLQSICFLILFSLGAAAYASGAPPGSIVLTLEDCINTAISGHPDLAAGRSDLEASEARVGQAQSSRYPSLGFSTGFSERSSGGTGPSEGSWSNGITLSQLVTDWAGRTRRSEGACWMLTAEPWPLRRSSLTWCSRSREPISSFLDP